MVSLNTLCTEHYRFNAWQTLGFEQRIFNVASYLCPDYDGDYWKGKVIEPGLGFAMPTRKTHYQIYVHGNCFEGRMSAEAFGLTATLFTLCHLAEVTRSERCTELYHRVRNTIITSDEATLVWAAID